MRNTPNKTQSAPMSDEQQSAKAAAANAAGLPVYLAKFPEGDSYAVVTKEQFEMASRMGYDVSTSTQQTRDADAGILPDDREARELARADQSPVRVTNAELAAFHRFCECAEDFESGGHDVPKAMMSQLVRIGLLRPAGPGRHVTTKFGDWMRDCDTKAPAEKAGGHVDMDALREAVSDFRKATYEFARAHDPDDHARMMDAQKRIFDTVRPAAADADARDSGCRMTGGICACRSGGSFGGCARERRDCCTNGPARAAAVGAAGQEGK